MDKTYREYLERQLQEAMDEFEKAKDSAIKDLQNMNYSYAQDWGAAYYTKIDKITAAGTKVMQLHQAMQAYDRFNNKEEQ